jgi:hypothetical protein
MKSKLVKETLNEEYPYSKNPLVSRLEKMFNSAAAAKNELDEMSIDPQKETDEELLDAFFSADGAIEELMDIIDKKIRQITN